MATSQLISTMATPLLVYQATAVFEAIDPVTGAAVTGVTITNPVLAGINLSIPADTSGENTIPPVAPQFVPVPLDTLNSTGTEG